jgi:anti-anti-sigma factor
VPAKPHPSPPSPSLVIRIDATGGVLCMSGELLAATAHLLDEAITAVLQTGRRHWRADVTDLLVWDTAGLRAIAAAQRRIRAHDCRFTLVGAPPGLRRTLASLGLGHDLLGQDPG